MSIFNLNGDIGKEHLRDTDHADYLVLCLGPTDIQSTFDRIDMLYKFHGRASGVPHGQVLLDFRQLM